MPPTGSQVFLLGPGASITAGWYLSPNKVIQAVASAVAVSRQPGGVAQFPPDGAVISVGGPIYILVNKNSYLSNATIPALQYIVRWPVTNMDRNWHVVKLTYTIISEDDIDYIPISKPPAFDGGE